MTITVEDGTGVEGANSYVSAAEARTYASARGFTFNTNIERYLIKAMDYIEGKRSQFKGAKIDVTYPLQWPRTCVYIDGFAVGEDAIPTELKQAQIRAAMAYQDGIDLMPTNTGAPFATMKKVGPIETRYSSGVRTSGVPTVRELDNLLAPLLRGGSMLSVERA